jgi:hypothetical protein
MFAPYLDQHQAASISTENRSASGSLDEESSRALSLHEVPDRVTLTETAP